MYLQNFELFCTPFCLEAGAEFWSMVVFLCGVVADWRMILAGCDGSS